ncbi:MAG: hypothetical protein E6H00_10300 [Bacillati bacterium ANGP1]|uniref:Uncharacterized protein n=1 Tax=Candidatus Segetimicrobium genomatis TaxID=2569760 RepID=A0A537K1A3_9BACT|nr:MAG: hypothetical protein E6H00_10300 [Terrabacteria group bacterium ANGP1]
MTDPASWIGSNTIVTLLLALIPALFRFREILLKQQDLVTEIAGIIVLMGGLVLYAETMPQWLQIQAQMAKMGLEVEGLQMLFFGSLGLMTLGGLLTLFGLLGRIMGGMKRK